MWLSRAGSPRPPRRRVGTTSGYHDHDPSHSMIMIILATTLPGRLGCLGPGTARNLNLVYYH